MKHGLKQTKREMKRSRFLECVIWSERSLKHSLCFLKTGLSHAIEGKLGSFYALYTGRLALYLNNRAVFLLRTQCYPCDSDSTESQNTMATVGHLPEKCLSALPGAMVSEI